jgi:hypothetical protein
MLRVVLVASGLPEVTCANQGGNQAPDRIRRESRSWGTTLLFGFDLTRKMG